MKVLRQYRQFSDPIQGTHGYYEIDGARYYTVEQDWEDNKPNVSCIPCGRYLVKPDFFNRGGYEALEIQNVIGRSEILFHKANVMDDVVGCIGVGISRGYIRTRASGERKWAVTQSSIAFARLMSWADGEDFLLIITGASNEIIY